MVVIFNSKKNEEQAHAPSPRHRSFTASVLKLARSVQVQAAVGGKSAKSPAKLALAPSASLSSVSSLLSSSQQLLLRPHCFKGTSKISFYSARLPPKCFETMLLRLHCVTALPKSLQKLLPKSFETLLSSTPLRHSSPPNLFETGSQIPLLQSFLQNLSKNCLSDTVRHSTPKSFQQFLLRPYRFTTLTKII